MAFSSIFVPVLPIVILMPLWANLELWEIPLKHVCGSMQEVPLKHYSPVTTTTKLQMVFLSWQDMCPFWFKKKTCGLTQSRNYRIHACLMKNVHSGCKILQIDWLLCASRKEFLLLRFRCLSCTTSQVARSEEKLSFCSLWNHTVNKIKKCVKVLMK